MTRRFRTAAALSAVLALAACSSSSPAAPPAPSSTAPQGVQSAKPGTAPAAPASSAKSPVGTALSLAIPAHNTVAATAIRVTLVKVVDPSTPASSFDEIPAGKRQVALQFRIVATGTTAYAADPVDRVKILDASGQSYSADLVPDTTAGPAVDTGLTLAPGDTALGYVTVTVPKGVKIATVEYTATPFGGDAAQWTVG